MEKRDGSWDGARSSGRREVGSGGRHGSRLEFEDDGWEEEKEEEGGNEGKGVRSKGVEYVTLVSDDATF